jgi:prevent-host-death family protein
MPAYSVAQARNSLPKLIDRAMEGEEVVITRHGKPVAELRPATVAPVQGVGSTAWLVSRALPSIGVSSVELLNQIYEEDEI